ncbi:glutamyl-tRNA reductase [Corynebacterium sp.]|uniref:glutamyl-tRNA reductase n=1 Tax=Corynebacterium sp. TaxID=1720 RepID=UPI0026DBEFE8|nr:glutamyl-tRNA reductase [Corynebacterium sp.]MDO4609909.1 glutamyl-tRNA reductase [Corynebacterium sp.]
MLLVGMSHRSAPVPVLERVTVAEADRPKVLSALLAEDAVTEAMLVSTCNRVEYYASVRGFHAGLGAVLREIVDRTGLDLDDLTPHLYVRYAEGAAEHMLQVAAGLDSMVVGEQQILGQIRASYQEADALGAAGRTIHELAQKALHAGKRVHSETGIDEAGASMVSVALDEAGRYLDPAYDPESGRGFAGRTALVLGAGAMSSLAATHLGRMGVDRIIVANRSVDRAENLAAHAIEAGVPATGIALSDYAAVLPEADVLVTATGSVTPVVAAAVVRAAVAERPHRPLAIADLSMPRDVEDGVGEVPGVGLFDIEHLQLSGADGVGEPDRARAAAIVREELDAYLAAQRALEVAPTVKALRERAGEVVAAELMRLEAKTPGLTERERSEVARAVQRVVDKLLHAPTVQVKKLSGEAGGTSYALALQRLFDLPLDAAEGLYSDTDIPTDLMVGDRMGHMLGHLAGPAMSRGKGGRRA